MLVASSAGKSISILPSSFAWNFGVVGLVLSGTFTSFSLLVFPCSSAEIAFTSVSSFVRVFGTIIVFPSGLSFNPEASGTVQEPFFFSTSTVFFCPSLPT